MTEGERKVKFNLEGNDSREFFMHGKVAMHKVGESKQRETPPSGIIKKR